MTKSLRASRVKKNKSGLRTRVFGPVEQARNERLNAKLMSLASQPKPESSKMDVEADDGDDANPADDEEQTRGRQLDADGDFDVDGNRTKTPPTRSKSVRAQKKAKEAKSAKIEKKKSRKPRNTMVFPKHPKKNKR